MSTPHPPAIAEGAYWIRNKNYGTVLSTGPTNSGLVTLAGQDKHTSRQDFRDHSQIWLIERLSDGVTFRIRNAQSGSVLDVRGWSTEDGAWVIIRGTLTTPYYRIVNVYTKKVLDQTSSAGNPVVSWAWNSGQHQHWSLEPVVLPPVYWITHAQTGWYLQNDPAKGGIAANKQPSTAPTRSQLWFLESQKDSDAYVIRNLEDDTKVLDLSGSGTADGTPVLTYDYHGGPNQQWKITDIDQTNPSEDRVRIVSVVAGTVVQVIEGSTYGTLQAQTNKNNYTQSWRLKAYPYPSIFWTTIQNLHTGMFLAQDNSVAVPSIGARHTLDYSTQWRFVANSSQPHHYSIINRGTGSVLVGKDSAPSVTVTQQSGNYLWALERSGNGIAIVNTTTIGALDHYDGKTTIQAYPNNGIDDPHHQWVAFEVSDRLPSFALVNARTGRSLTFKSGTEKGGIMTTENAVNELQDQWLFENLSGENISDNPIYAIISKVSGNVLDHWDGSRIEAYNDDRSDPHHRWKLVPCPCGERYFQIQNVATSRYLEERETGVPNANATTPIDHTNVTESHRAQCWELVSSRFGDFDLSIMDDDVLRTLLVYMQPDDSSTISHRIVKRAPGREKKGKEKKAHIPQNPRLLQDVRPTIRAIFQHVIDEWEDDTIASTAQAGTRVSTTRQEVERRWDIQVPQALRERSGQQGWIRIDIQGTYNDASGQRVANIQGQWLNESIFHIIVPVGVRVGREIIRAAMRRSLEDHTSIIIAQTQCAPPRGGTKPGTTPRPPPGPSGGSGNGWIYFAVAASFVVLLSPLGI
ncbi:hypothetical protein L873DRAFT_1809985 [Choiromyces venosus 120613-1]|uniref:Ricin B lectin domain-containing protein n=1 Tax=Choiromyces venosus 120613-1 TaxID=1336337 RepID=A0A3N4JIW5_9PEZI|nr:hypothetical protein L873DRAFT_1809985 [Choiromyces venosus 120613-1]